MQNIFVSIFTALFLATSAQIKEGYAYTNGDLYKDCKPFVDRAFDPSTDNDLLCTMYFTAVFETMATICMMDEMTNQDLSFLGADVDAIWRDSIEATIKNYVNRASREPEKWEQYPAVEVMTSIRTISPCQ